MACHPNFRPKNNLNGRSDYNILQTWGKAIGTRGVNRRHGRRFGVDRQKVDAVVIGAGAGGLCAAARLAHAGLYTLVVDDKDRLGGRASTEQIDGFTVNIGAIAIELGGIFEETFRTVGVPLDIRVPEPASSFFIDGKLIDVGRGGWSLLLGQLTKQASRILEKFADARSGNLPDGRQ
jgi:phytoene desaturase